MLDKCISYLFDDNGFEKAMLRVHT